MSRKPNSDCQIMVFRPTMEEFSDFSRYIMFMESQGAHRGGVAKIIPPKEWSPCSGYDNIDNLPIPAPISQVVTGQKGLYTQYNIQQKPMTVKEMRRLANTDKHSAPFHENYEDLERTYWKNITFNPAIYGADISGSLYDKDVSVWNVARLDTILDLVENDTGVKIEGVNTAYLYFGMWKTSFAWHTEDMDLYSINYVHFGAPKSWYSIPPEHGKRLERLATGFFPNSKSTCPAFLRHKMTLISPSVLRQYGIPFNKITQEAGEFMITFPYGYHSGFNHGFNCAESTNFASERWIKYGIVAEKCACRKDMVFINMDLFVKAFQPEKYECWKQKKYDVKLSYTDIPTVPDFSQKPVHWRTRLKEIKKAYKASLASLQALQDIEDAETERSPSSAKKDKNLPECSKLPQLKLVKAEILNNVSASPSKSPKKVTGPTSQCDGFSPTLHDSTFPNTFQIKMGTVLPIDSVSNLGQFFDEGTSDSGMTLMDRIKMGKRNGQGAAPKMILHSPPYHDHAKYTKKFPTLEQPQNYPPLQVRMKMSQFGMMPHWNKFMKNSDHEPPIRSEENKLCQWKIRPGPSDLPSSSSMVPVSENTPNVTPKDSLEKLPRPPLKRRHPVSKKGPSKKSSPAVVLKNGSADSDSSAEEETAKVTKVPNTKIFNPKSKSDTYVEKAGYPTLWPRIKTSYKAERQYNATVAKLPPYCAVCSLFHPYYQKSFTSDTAPPPLSELLQRKGLVAGNKSKPLIPETIFASSTGSPAPFASCEQLDERGQNTLIQCKACKVQVHMSCYGISRAESPWTCDRCSFKAWIAQCCLCSLRGGVLKPVNNGQQWAHVLCAVAIPEVSFDDIPQRNGINIKNLTRARQKLKCTYCKRNRNQDWHTLGSCIQCCAGSCITSFHPTCALAAGIKMEPGDWPLSVFVYCHRHASQKERISENKINKELPDISIGQRVYGKHRNGRYYASVVKSETLQSFHHVVFTDKSWSDNLYEQDIVSHDFSVAHPKPGDTVTVKWTDGKSYEAEYVERKRHHMLTVEFEDGSNLVVERKDLYTNFDEMPKKIQRRLSNATVMSKLDFLRSPKKEADNQSFVSRRAAFNASKRKMIDFEDYSESSESR